MDTASSSSPPRPTLWQVLQLIRWLEDRRGSKNSILPSSTLDCVSSLPSMTGGYLGMGSKVDFARSIRSSAAAEPARTPRLRASALTRGRLIIVLSPYETGLVSLVQM